MGGDQSASRFGMGCLATVGVTTGVLLAACGVGGDGPSLPIEDAAWDGDGFVVHNNAFADDSAYWTSPDGLEWQRVDGFPMTALPFPCHPDFPCDLEPGEIEEVPFHFAEPWSQALAGHGDIVIQEVGVDYRTSRSDDGEPEKLHPQLLALAARDSDCFARLQADARAGRQPERDEDAHLSAWEWSGSTFTATCQPDGAIDRFSISFDDHLDKRQLALITGGAPTTLVVTGADGSQAPVIDPPTTTWRDDVSIERRSISPIVASSNRFWSLDQGRLVWSADGSAWQPVALAADGWQADAVVANPGGDVAVALRPAEGDGAGAGASEGAGADVEPSTHLLVSHDDGGTWGQPVESSRSFRSLIDVGPAGVAVIHDGDELLIIDDRTGEVALTLGDRMVGLLIDVGIGRDTVVVPELVVGPDGRDDAVYEVLDLSGRLVATVD